jgi:hypothetical protein
LLRAGFLPLPLHGKLPAFREWQKRTNTTPGDIEIWDDSYPLARNTGVLTALAPALDIDITNADAAQAIEDMVRERFEERGYILVRFGNSPKRAILFRTDTPFAKFNGKLVAPDGGTDQKLEFLADGQQIVVAGIHPATKKPYTWLGDEPGAIKREDLPYISAEEATALVNDAVGLLVTEHGYSHPASKDKHDQANGEASGGADWSELLANLHAGHELHENIAKMAAKLVTTGMGDGAAVNLIRGALNNSAVPRDDRFRDRYDDIPRAVRTARGKYQTTDSQPPERRFKLVPFNTLTVGSDIVYLVKGLIPRTGLVVVWGPPKCGKSFWVFDLVMHPALGWVYRGRKTVSGPIVYCAFEGAEGYGRRAEAFRRHHSLDAATSVPFYLVPARMTFAKDHQALISSIKVQLGDTQPIAVVLDTLNRSLGGSESDDEDMANYIRAGDAVREAFGCVVIIVHHCGIEGTRPRGHTSLTGAVDAQLAVKRDGTGNIIVNVEWMKDGPEGETVVSRLEPLIVGKDKDEDDNDITSCVIVAVEDATPPVTAKPKKHPKMPKTASIALRALQKAVNEMGEVPPASNHVPANMRIVTSETWRKYAYAMGVSTGEERAKQKAFKTATDHLIAHQLVGAWQDQFWPA